MPFTGTDEIHMRAPTCKYADSKSGFNDMVGIEIRYRQGNLAVFFILGIRFTELFPAEQPLREGARQRRRMDPRGGLKTNVKRSISRACHFERSERSLPFAVRDSRFPHMCRALLRFSHLSFIPLEPYPARFARHLPHGGRLTKRDMFFFHLFSCPPGICFHALPGTFASCHPTVPFTGVQERFLASLEMTIQGEAVFSFR